MSQRDLRREFPLETGIPFTGGPPSRGGRYSDFPFYRMKVGQSFFFPTDKVKISDEPVLMHAVQKARERTRFNLQRSREDNPPGFRIHRLPGEYQPRPRKRKAKSEE